MEHSHEKTSAANQLVISHELLHLLEWLIENEQETLKKLISKALKSGYQFKTSSEHEGKKPTSITDEKAHDHIITFLELMDLLLSEVTQEYDTTQHRLTRFHHPALDHIDSSICGAETISQSVAYASKCKSSSTKVTQDILLKELLKRWKPAKKTFIN